MSGASSKFSYNIISRSVREYHGRTDRLHFRACRAREMSCLRHASPILKVDIRFLIITSILAQEDVELERWYYRVVDVQGSIDVMLA